MMENFENIKLCFNDKIEEMPIPLSFIDLEQNFLDYFDEKSLNQFIFYSKESSNDIILNNNIDFEKIIKDI